MFWWDCFLTWMSIRWLSGQYLFLLNSFNGFWTCGLIFFLFLNQVIILIATILRHKVDVLVDKNTIKSTFIKCLWRPLKIHGIWILYFILPWHLISKRGLWSPFSRGKMRWIYRSQRSVGVNISRKKYTLCLKCMLITNIMLPLILLIANLIVETNSLMVFLYRVLFRTLGPLEAAPRRRQHCQSLLFAVLWNWQDVELGGQRDLGLNFFEFYEVFALLITSSRFQRGINRLSIIRSIHIREIIKLIATLTSLPLLTTTQGLETDPLKFLGF